MNYMCSMGKINKGALTRQFLITEARRVFNENGITLTLGELASKMGVTIARITNHFRTKDQLIVALSDDYEQQYGELQKSFSKEGKVSLIVLAELMEKVMQLQYEHRCLMLLVCATGISQDEVYRQISAKWNTNLERFKYRIVSLVDGGILDQSALVSENYEILKFQYINLFTTWLVSQTLYDSDRPLRKSKKIYIKGILYTFYPYLTRKGKTELAQILKDL
jgi:AcrR family transcriptional regulator